MISKYSLLGFPLTSKEIREITFEYADENCYKWFYGFMKCHDKLCVNNGVTNLSLAHALGSSQCIIDQLFDMCQSLLEQLNIMDPKYI